MKCLTDKRWGCYKEPEVLERQSDAALNFAGIKMIDGARHRVQQEQSEKVANEVVQFLQNIARSSRA